MNTLTAYINGAYTAHTPAAETFASINPANGNTLAVIQHSDAAEIDAAVAGAIEGQKIWAAKTAVERSRILLAAVAILRSRNNELAQLETLHNGKHLSQTRYVHLVTRPALLE